MAVIESVAMLLEIVEIVIVRDGGVGGEAGQGWELMLHTRLKRGYASVTPPVILGEPEAVALQGTLACRPSPLDAILYLVLPVLIADIRFWIYAD